VSDQKESSNPQTPDPLPEGKDHGVLYVGVDLGTSRTSVCASNGVRETLASYVGYPKDVVSRKALGKEVLFGQEALDNRLSLRFFRPLEKGELKGTDQADSQDAKENLAAAKDLIHHTIQLCMPRKDELIYAVIGVPAQASIHNKKAIIEAARDTVDSVMLCSEPFAVAYSIDRLMDVLVIDIGAGTVDLCRMHGTMPEDADQITLYTGGDWLDQEIYKEFQAACPGADFTINMVKSIKEKYAFVGDVLDPVKVEFPVKGKPTTFDVTEPLRKACKRIIPPIVEAIHELVASFDPEFQERLRRNVLLAGGGSQIRALDVEIEKEMKERLGGGRVERIEDPLYAGANGALKIAHDMPGEYWQQLR